VGQIVTERVFVLRDVRVFYRKKGAMKFVSHLDMNRFMTRLVNKGKIPVWFTEGFNQHAYFNFAVPLSLGFEGGYEILDLRIVDPDYSNEQLVADLNRVSIPDIEFVLAAEPVYKMKDIAFAEFEITFDSINDELAQKINSFFAKESIITQKTTKKGGTKDIDIAPLIKKAELCENMLTLILTAGNENNLNPTLVLKTMFETEGLEPIYYTVKRTMIYNKEMQSFK
jgi:radical SAM-linked protein